MAFKRGPKMLVRKWWNDSTTIPECGCWIYLGALNDKGYAPIYRKAYKILVGEVPAGMELDHKCRVRSCWNPQHLQPVTRIENVRRGKINKHHWPSTQIFTIV
jgi:hypothetical protein